MKRILGLLLVLGTAGLSAHAQSTMPAIGANTPKGEVSKTDASVNQTGAADKSNASSKNMGAASKHVHKTKTTKTKATSTM